MAKNGERKTTRRHGRGHIHHGMGAGRRVHGYAGIKFDNFIAAGVNHHRFVVGIDGAAIHGVLSQVPVPIKMNGRLIHIVDIAEGLEPLMEQVRPIAESQRRGMGDEQGDADRQGVVEGKSG